MWNKPRPEKDDSLAAKVVRYRRRPARYADAALAKRREEFWLSFAMLRLAGEAGSATRLASPSSIEVGFAELWISGRISRGEYVELCNAYTEEATRTG